MSEAESRAAPDLRDHPFAIARCPRCGYDLRGLDGSGPCPECGQPFGPATLRIVGTRVVSRTLPRVVFVLPFVAYWYPIAQSQNLPFWIGHLLLGLSLLVLALVMLRRAAHRRALVAAGDAQMILAPEGVALRDGIGPIEVVPWTRAKGYRLRPYWRWRLTMKPERPAWYLTVSSGGILDPMRLSGEMPDRRAPGFLYMDLLFEASAEEAAQLHDALAALSGLPG